MSKTFTIGVMRTVVEETEPQPFQQMVETAVARVEEQLAETQQLQIDVFDFPGPHLTPVEGSYSPLHFMRLALAEKLERDLNFLLLVTEVDLSAAAVSYVVALPSQLTNIGILSTKRLEPSFWGREPDVAVTTERLTALMLHTLGHLLNLRHQPEKTNVMHDFQRMSDLNAMQEITPEQLRQFQENLPREAREERATQNRARFALRQIVDNRGPIAHALIRANPLRLVLRLPTMLTAGLSVASVLFFSAETWDVASTLSFTALILFSLMTVLIATGLLYSTFSVGPEQDRTLGLAETTVVTVTATFTSLLLTMVLVFLFFFLLTLFSGLTFFPAKLKETWPTVDPAVRLAEHIKLAFFVGGMGVLTGSLGGRADSKRVIRQVLFLDEET